MCVNAHPMLPSLCVQAANVLLSAAGAVKISDLGVAGQLSGTMNYRKNTFVRKSATQLIL